MRCLLLLLLLASALCFGCARNQLGIDEANTKQSFVELETTATLGSTELATSIPGSGPLRIEELNAWLNEPSVHEPLDVSLPKHLNENATVVIPSDNPLTRAKIELGRQLFFDKRLSGLGTFACATCHRPEQSFSSYQVMPEVGRNASAVINRVLGDEHFWDGRASALEEQPLSPIKNPFEMNSSPEKSTAKIKAIDGYRLQFEKIFGSVTFENICKALACFERTIVTGESAWDRRQLSESAMRGEELFFSDRLACGECHTGANLTDEGFHNLGTDQLVDYNDRGRAKVTNADADIGGFKTPTLRNVALTPPYMHNGVFRTLEQVVDFFDKGGVQPVADSTAATVVRTHPLKPLSLSDQEKQDVIEFLKSLSSELPRVETGRLPE